MFAIIRKKHIIAAAAAVLALLLIPAGVNGMRGRAVEASAQANANWGLSFQKGGETPVGNASADFLRQNDAYYAGDASQKWIYLTFDAGYEAGYTPAILDALKKHNVRAAFFVVGNYLETSPDLVKRMSGRPDARRSAGGG